MLLRWTRELKDAVERKRKAYRKMLKGNVAEEGKGRRKREYKACRNQVKRMVRENKRRVDEEFGRALCDKFRDNKKKCFGWK